MKDRVRWNSLDLLARYIDTFLMEDDASISINTFSNVNSFDGSETTARRPLFDENPLLSLPFDVRENIMTESYETGKSSMAQQYIENIYIKTGKYDSLQKLFNDLFFYAGKENKHILSYNIMLILSQIPYCYLGTWACTLAVAATRNRYLDVMELGIRCFENWEDKEACSFLKGSRFEESWLQEYADEVCEYILSIKEDNNVLFEKDYSWKMAEGKYDSTSDTKGHFSRYSSNGIKN